MESLSLQSVIAIQNARLNLALRDAKMESLFRLSVAIEYRDRETGKHIHRVSEYSEILAAGIGLDRKEVDMIKSTMPIHDIGKIAIPDKILLKSESGRIFDPKMVETFMDNLEEIRRIKMTYPDHPDEKRWIE